MAREYVTFRSHVKPTASGSDRARARTSFSPNIQPDNLPVVASVSRPATTNPAADEFAATFKNDEVRTMTRGAVWALLVSVCLGAPASAQDTIAISGVVTTRSDGAPVAGAVIS